MKINFIIILLALFLVISPVFSKSIASDSGNGMTSSDSLCEAIQVEKTIKNNGEWSNIVQSTLGQIIRFKINITYHADNPNSNCTLVNITVDDILPNGLSYNGNATICKENISSDGKTITWNLEGIELLNGDSFEFEFDAITTDLGTQINNVNVTAIETCICYKTRHGKAQATVIVNPYQFEELPYVKIIKPEQNYQYIFNIKFKDLENRIEIIGPITIKAEAESENGIEKVEFYIDDELKKIDKNTPYTWLWIFKPLDNKEEYTINVVAYDNEGNTNTDVVTVIRSKIQPIRNHPLLSLAFGGITLAAIIKNRQADDTEPLKPDDGDDSYDHKQVPNSDAGGPYSGIVGEPVEFDATNSSDLINDDLIFEWDFGDGKKGFGEKTRHTYDEAGKYTVKLTVINSLGKSNTDTTNVEISEKPIGGDEAGLFWYIITGLASILTVMVGLLFFRRRIYV